MKRQWFLDSFGAPVADIRAKLIEEAWFGRRVSEPSQNLSKDWGWAREEEAYRPQQTSHSDVHGNDLER